MGWQEQRAACGSSCHDLSIAVTVVFAWRRALGGPGLGCVPRAGAKEGDAVPCLSVPTLRRCADRSSEGLARGVSSVSRCVDLARWCVGLICRRGCRTTQGQQELFACVSTISGLGRVMDRLRCQASACCGRSPGGAAVEQRDPGGVAAEDEVEFVDQVCGLLRVWVVGDAHCGEVRGDAAEQVVLA